MAVRRPLVVIAGQTQELPSGDTLPGGGGGSGTAEIVTMSFGGTYTDKAQSVLTGRAWVTAGMSIMAQVLTPTGMDADEMRLYEFTTIISDKVIGTGYTLTIYSEPEYTGSIDVMITAL